MATISANVGKDATNSPEDVRTVQQLLNQNILRLAPLKPCAVSGICDSQTIALIEQFQRVVLGFTDPDGRVDPGGRTLTALQGITPPTAGEPTIDGVALLSDAPAKVLREILKAAGLSRATVTSGVRTPAEQARVMYENCLSKGPEFNLRLYAPPGQKVVQVFIDNRSKPRDPVIGLMLAKINELGPETVSKHCSTTHFVFDVAPSSIPEAKRADFEAAIRAHGAVSKLIPPPGDPAFHIEIPKN